MTFVILSSYFHETLRYVFTCSKNICDLISMATLHFCCRSNLIVCPTYINFSVLPRSDILLRFFYFLLITVTSNRTRVLLNTSQIVLLWVRDSELEYLLCSRKLFKVLFCRILLMQIYVENVTGMFKLINCLSTFHSNHSKFHRRSFP